MSWQELVGQKKSLHLSAFRFLVEELGRDLRRIADEEGAEARLARDPDRLYGGRHTIAKLLERIVGLVREVLRRWTRRATPTTGRSGGWCRR